MNPSVAKGLYRKQLTYAKSILEELMRHQLMDMLTWYVGVTTDLQCTVGFLAKDIQTHISRDR